MKKIDLNLFNKNENAEIKKVNDSLVISYNNEYSSSITYEEVEGIFKGIQYNRDNYINIDLETDDKYSAQVRVLFYCENAEKPSITVYYDIYPQIKTRIKLKLNIFDSQSRFLPPLPGTGKGLLEGKPSDPSKLWKIGIDIKSLKTENKAKAYIHSVFISEKEENIIATGPVLVDEFGQLTLRDWPGKIKSFEQLSFTLKKFREDSEKQSTFPNRSRFGGCLDLKFEPTGYFRTEHDGKRFWIVDPDGYAFISCGICYGSRMGDFGWVSGFEKFYKWLPDKNDKLYKDAWITADKIPEYVKRYGIENARDKWLFNFHRANMIRIYKDEWWQAWTEINGKRLKAWGFNTIGIGVNNHEDERVEEFLKIAKIPYTITLKNYPKTEKCIFRDMPDVFSKEFRQKSKTFAKQIIKYCEDPYLLGYFINNEPEWMSQQLNMTEYMLKTNVEYESKGVFIEFLKKRYVNDTSLLNNSWGTKFSDFIDIYKPINCTSEGFTKDTLDFDKILIKNYCDIPSEEIKIIDNKHINLGTRYCSASKKSRIKCDYLDVFSFNCYGEPHKPYTALEEIGKTLNLPVIIGEYHFSSEDHGMLQGGLFPVFKTQADRGAANDIYMKTAVSSAYGVGAHYFEYNDQPLLGRFDGEAFQIGLIDVCNQPYYDMVKKVSDTNRNIYKYAREMKVPGK